jgi:O-antigen/teichoic acid export membrane protein
VPAAALNNLVAQSFVLLFMPAAIRAYARRDLDGLREHHWQSAAWVAVLSFPIFGLTFGVAPHLVELLLGADYEGSAAPLALLAFGHYLSVCLGFNNQMLQVLGRTRAIVWTDVMTIIIGGSLAALLCAPYGALGAAVAVTAARVVGAFSLQLLLLRTSEISSVPRTQVRVWLRVLLASAFIAVFGWLWQPPLLAQVIIVAIASLALLRSTAQILDITRSFPELLRVPLVARVAGA